MGFCFAIWVFWSIHMKELEKIQKLHHQCRFQTRSLFFFFFKLLNLTLYLLIGEFRMITETYIMVTDKPGNSSSSFVFLLCPTIFILSLIQFCLSGSSTLDFIIHILFKSNIIRPSNYKMIQNVRVIFINQLPPISHFIIVQ